MNTLLSLFNIYNFCKENLYLQRFSLLSNSITVHLWTLRRCIWATDLSVHNCFNEGQNLETHTDGTIITIFFLFFLQRILNLRHMLVLLAKYPVVPCNAHLHIAQKWEKVIKHSYQWGILQIILVSSSDTIRKKGNTEFWVGILSCYYLKMGLIFIYQVSWMK